MVPYFGTAASRLFHLLNSFFRTDSFSFSPTTATTPLFHLHSFFQTHKDTFSLCPIFCIRSATFRLHLPFPAPTMFFSLLTFLFTLPTLIISAPSPLFRLTPDSLTAPPQIAGKPLVINTLNARYPYLGIDLPGADRDFVGYFKDSKNLTGEVYVNGVLVNEVAERVQIL